MLKDNLTGCYCNLFVFPQAIEYTTAIIIPMMVCTSTETKRLMPIIFLLSMKSKEIISVTLVLRFIMSKTVLTWETLLNLIFYQLTDHGFGY